MADNTQLSTNIGTGDIAATASLTISGDTAKVQMVGCGILSGAEGTWVYSQFVGGAGAVAAGVQRVTLASDDPAVALLTTIDSDTSTLAVVGGGVEATALRVTVATDSTGVLSVDDNGAALTVDWNGTTPPIGAGTEAAALRVTLATDSTGTLTVDTTGTNGLEVVQAAAADLNVTEASAAAIKTAVELIDDAVSGAGFNVTQFAGAAVPIGAGTEAAAVRVTLATDSTGLLSIDDNGGSLTIDQPAVATGGASFFKSIDLDESEEQVKGTAATFYGGVVINLKATPLYLKLYDAASGDVTVGTTVPDLTFPIPSQGDTNGAGFVIPVPACGIQFGTALTVACTTGIADNDSGAPGANECAVSLFYE